MSVLKVKNFVVLLLLQCSIIFGQQTIQQNVRVIHVCENAEENIQCSKGQVIRVTKAVYGRYTMTECQHYSIFTTMCCSSNSFRIVQGRCNGYPSCTLEANNRIFGDPCPNTYKYLEVKFQCLRGLEAEDLIKPSPSCVQMLSSTTATRVVSSTFPKTISTTFETTTAAGTRAVTTQTPTEPSTSKETETKAVTTTISTQTPTVELLTPYKSNEPSVSNETGLIIVAAFGSLIFIIIVGLLGFIIRCRYLRKTRKEGNSNIYSDLEKTDQVKNRIKKDHTQEYASLSQVAAMTNQQTAIDFSNYTEYHVLEPSNLSQHKTVPSKDAANVNDALYAILDPSETGFDRRTNQNRKQTQINKTTPSKDASCNNGAFYAIFDPSVTGFDRRTHHNNNQLQMNPTSSSKNDCNGNGAFYAVLDPLETGFNRRNNKREPNEYLEFEPNATGYNRKNKTTLQYPGKETMFQMSDMYEFAKPTTSHIEQENEDETDYTCCNVFNDNDFRPSTDNIYAHTEDDVYDVSSHVRQTNDRDSSYGQFGS